ncbi:MAG: polysaccharide deacetylase family protein [Deltaproteobacteria bacterium]|nr:polysaccharide deacetylase family protein [Deltaproteobacteria bacterium]
MPLRLRILLIIAVSCLLSLLFFSIFWLASQSFILSVQLLTFYVITAGYFLFVYVPRFDPTGLTLWRLKTKHKLIALTFDDGPSLYTKEVLEIMAKYKIKATFFFLGENAQRHPDIVAQTRTMGHAIGSHGFSHHKMHRLNEAEISREFTMSAAILAPIAKVRNHALLRLPHGFKSITLMRCIRKYGYQLIAWTSGVWDSERPIPAVLVRRLQKALKPGAIILLHDGDGINPDLDRSSTVTALSEFIPFAQHSGYKFVTIPELFA